MWIPLWGCSRHRALWTAEPSNPSLPEPRLIFPCLWLSNLQNSVLYCGMIGAIFHLSHQSLGLFSFQLFYHIIQLLHYIFRLHNTIAVTQCKSFESKKIYQRGFWSHVGLGARNGSKISSVRRCQTTNTVLPIWVLSTSREKTKRMGDRRPSVPLVSGYRGMWLTSSGKKSDVQNPRIRQTFQADLSGQVATPPKHGSLPYKTRSVAGQGSMLTSDGLLALKRRKRGKGWETCWVSFLNSFPDHWLHPLPRGKVGVQGGRMPGMLHAPTRKETSRTGKKHCLPTLGNPAGSWVFPEDLLFVYLP